MKTIYLPKLLSVAFKLDLQKIVIMDDEESEEHGAYIIELHTCEGIIKIKGDHDMGPNLEKTDIVYEEDN